jgi:hypothetical protein
MLRDAIGRPEAHRLGIKAQNSLQMKAGAHQQTAGSSADFLHSPGK